MTDYIGVSEAATRLQAEHGVTVRPHDLSHWIYRRRWPDLWVRISGRWVIAPINLAAIATALRCPRATQ